MRQKELYAAPETEVLELRLEGVIASSPTVGFGDDFSFDGEEL